MGSTEGKAKEAHLGPMIKKLQFAYYIGHCRCIGVASKDIKRAVAKLAEIIGEFLWAKHTSAINKVPS